MKGNKVRTKKIPIDLIKFDPAIYPRANYGDGAFWQTVQRYLEAYQSGSTFPPLHVAKRGDMYPILDGYNRYQMYKKAGVEEVECIVHDEPEDQWLLIATRLNAQHGKQLTSQDRTMIANRLRAMGISIMDAAKLLHMKIETLTTWLDNRVAQIDGTDVVAKSAVKHLVGTVHQSAIADQGPIANASIFRTLDEFEGLLRCRAIDVTRPEIRARAARICEQLSQMLRDTEPPAAAVA